MRFQFGTRSLLFVVLLLMIPCAIVGKRVHFYQRQEAIFARFRNDDALAVDVIPVQTDPLTSWLLGGSTRKVFDVTVVQGNADDLLKTLVDAGATEIEIVVIGIGRGDEDSSPTISNVGVEVLGRLPQLRALIVFDVDVPPSALRSFHRMQQLQDLTVWGDWLQDEHLAAIPAMPSLEKLSVNSTNITETGLVVLRRHPKLVTLELPQNIHAELLKSEDRSPLRRALPHLFLTPAGQGIGGGMTASPSE